MLLLLLLVACRPHYALSGLWAGTVTCEESVTTDVTVVIHRVCSLFTCPDMDAEAGRDGPMRTESGAEFQVHMGMEGPATLDRGMVKLDLQRGWGCSPETLRDGDETWECDDLPYDDVDDAMDGSWDWDGGDTLTYSEDGCTGELTFCDGCGHP